MPMKMAVKVIDCVENRDYTFCAAARRI